MKKTRRDVLKAIAYLTPGLFFIPNISCTHLDDGITKGQNKNGWQEYWPKEHKNMPFQWFTWKHEIGSHIFTKKHVFLLTFQENGLEEEIEKEVYKLDKGTLPSGVGREYNFIIKNIEDKNIAIDIGIDYIFRYFDLFLIPNKKNVGTLEHINLKFPLQEGIINIYCNDGEGLMAKLYKKNGIYYTDLGVLLKK